MQKPRLIYYNDAHHFHGKRIEPPVSIHMLHSAQSLHESPPGRMSDLAK